MKSLFKLTLLTLLLLACNQEETNSDNIVEPFIGVWSATEICGGIVSDCNPISDEEYHTVEFTEDGRYLYTEDEIVTSDFAYVILETIDVEPSGTIYNVEFVDEFITQMTLFEENKLQIIGGDFYIEYER